MLESALVVRRCDGPREDTEPASSPARLTFGPEPHGGSTFDRPGDEWGTGFRFDQSGCRRIGLRRTGTSGTVWLRVDRIGVDVDGASGILDVKSP